MATLLPNGEQVFLDNDGVPLAGGKVFFYIPNTTTPKNTWTDPDQTTFNTNPVILDAAGRAIIYGSGAYRQIVKDALDNIIWDQLTADTTASGGFSWAGDAGGTPNAITVTATAFTSTDGQQIGFIATATNTGTATLNPNGDGPIQIVKDTDSGPQPLAGGEITTGNVVIVTYDESGGYFHLVAYPTTAPFKTLASASTTDLGTINTRNVTVTGINDITSFGSSANINQPLYYVVFTGVLTLKYNATSMLLPGSADIQTANGDFAIAQYLGSANWRVVTFQRSNGLPISSGLIGGSSNLRVTNGGSPGTTARATATKLVVLNAQNSAQTLTAVDVAANTATVGANGLDTGTVANNTWYAVFVIAKNDGTAAALLSTSATAPTLPTDYPYFTRVGWMRTDGSATFYRTLQIGTRAQYVVTPASNTAAMRIMASGVAGNVFTPTYASVSVSPYVPSTASSIIGSVQQGATSVAAVAPNTNYGTAISTTNSPPVAPAVSGSATMQYNFLLESTSIYWISSSVDGVLYCLGWEDQW